MLRGIEFIVSAQERCAIKRRSCGRVRDQCVRHNGLNGPQLVHGGGASAMGAEKALRIGF